MHISWYYELFVNVSLGLSFVFNSLFIYLNLSDRKKTLGTYQYFLLAFSIFNTIYSIVDPILPIAIYGSNYVLIVYLSGGPFVDNLAWGQLAVSIRGGFVALSYGILTIHFVYRYFALFNPMIIDTLTSQRGVIGLFLVFLTYGMVWATVAHLTMYGTEIAREVARKDFLDNFGKNISEVSFLNIVYRSDDWSTIVRTWTGLAILVTISGASITLYCILGFKIVQKLKQANHVSKNTRRLHHQLFRTLVIQTSIPTLISFLPCMVVWVLPYFGTNLGDYGNIGVMALSAFPSVDALAVILLLPIYRNRLIGVSSGGSENRVSSTYEARKV